MLLTNSGISTKDWSTNAKHWAPYRMRPDQTKRCEFWTKTFLARLSKGTENPLHIQTTKLGFWLVLIVLLANRIEIYIAQSEETYMLLSLALGNRWLDLIIALFINLTHNCCTVCLLTPRSVLALIFSRATLVIFFSILPESDKCPCRSNLWKRQTCACCPSPFLGPIQSTVLCSVLFLCVLISYLNHLFIVI